MVKKIRVLALDIDGVLTDGTAQLANSTAEAKRFSFQDLDAVTQAKRAGLTIALITGEESPSVSQVAERFGLDRVTAGAKDKVAAITALSEELEIPLDEFCYVGDGDRDAPALARVGLAFAPANATPAAKAAAHRVLSKAGGTGAVAEVLVILNSLETDATQCAGMVEEMRSIVTDSVAAHQRLLEESLPLLVQIALTLRQTIQRGNKILLFGNGGSAADAQHVAGELVGRFARESEPWPAIALTTDTSILTAVGNDWEYSQVFARQVRALARPGDVVVGITTSGNSPNVLRGLEAARDRGATTVGFTGGAGGAMPEHCDLCFVAPAQATPRIQELHILGWHAICELVEKELTNAGVR